MSGGATSAGLAAFSDIRITLSRNMQKQAIHHPLSVALL
jgi:hypothetical protein